MGFCFLERNEKALINDLKKKMYQREFDEIYRRDILILQKKKKYITGMQSVNTPNLEKKYSAL